jgi:hypothetical protein
LTAARGARENRVVDLSSLPAFPALAWDGFSWVTSAKLETWAGYQIRNGPYGTVSTSGPSDGTVAIRFAPEGRNESPLAPGEIALVRWLIDNEAAVHDAMLNRLFEEYPHIRSEWLEAYSEQERDKVLPIVKTPADLKELIGVAFVNVHPIAKDHKPFIGVELGCTWEQEHGVGILLHGAKALKIGGAETAFTKWIVEKFAK